jgi:cytoskeletal protein RodZ
MDELISELKARRENLGLSLQDLFRKTRIDITFLEALEEGDFEILPEAYVKLFLKRYAQEVKLDSDEIVRRFEKLQWKAKSETRATSHRASNGVPGLAIGMSAAAILATGVALFVTLSEEEEVRPSLAALLPAASRPTPPAAKPARVKIQTVAIAAPSDGPTETVQPPAPAPADESRREDTPVKLSDPAPSQMTTENLARPAIAKTRDPSPKGTLTEEVPHDPATTTTGAETASVLALSPPAAEIAERDAAEPNAEISTEKVVSAYSLPQSDLSTTTGPLSLVATGLEGTQVTVTSDGEPVFDNQVDAGRRVAWEARDRFSIEIQNGAGLSLRLQGKDLPAFATAGRKVRLYISRSSIWIEEVEPVSPNTGDTERP